MRYTCTTRYLHFPLQRNVFKKYNRKIISWYVINKIIDVSKIRSDVSASESSPIFVIMNVNCYVLEIIFSICTLINQNSKTYLLSRWHRRGISSSLFLLVAVWIDSCKRKRLLISQILFIFLSRERKECANRNRIASSSFHNLSHKLLM